MTYCMSLRGKGLQLYELVTTNNENVETVLTVYWISCGIETQERQQVRSIKVLYV